MAHRQSKTAEALPHDTAGLCLSIAISGHTDDAIHQPSVGLDCTCSVNGSCPRWLFLQRLVRPCRIVVLIVLPHDPARRRFKEDNHVTILSISGPDEVFGRHRRAAPQPAGSDIR